MTAYRSSGCLITDYKCICNSIPLKVAFVSCCLGACNQAQVQGEYFLLPSSSVPFIAVLIIPLPASLFVFSTPQLNISVLIIAIETHNAAVSICARYGVTLPSQDLGSAVSVVASTPAVVTATIVEVHTTASVATTVSASNGSAATVYITEVINNNPATTAGTPASTDTSTGGVAKISGSGFAAAAAIGVALFIL